MSMERMFFKGCFAASVALLFCGIRTAGQEKHLTAREVIGRIQAHVGMPWQAETVDTFKAGNPDEPVTGVALTMMATMDEINSTASTGKNLIITHEPTFYNHLDKLDVLPEKEKDPVLAAKLAFIAEHHLVVWRFHDHWHRRTPDGIEAGMAHALGWEKQQDAENQYLFTVPETTLESLAADLKKKLDIHVLRVIGNPLLQGRHHLEPLAVLYGGIARIERMWGNVIGHAALRGNDGAIADGEVAGGPHLASQDAGVADLG